MSRIKILPKNPRSLAEEFPMLHFAKEADRWLLFIHNKSIFWQLDSRKIDYYEILPTLSTAGLGVEERTNKFRVLFNEYCVLGHGFEALGHEIGHTFGFDLTHNPPVTTIDQQSRELMYDFDAEGDPNGFYLEDFCDAFSLRWMAINSKEKVCRNCAVIGDSLLAAFILMLSNASDRCIHP